MGKGNKKMEKKMEVEVEDEEVGRGGYWVQRLKLFVRFASLF